MTVRLLLRHRGFLHSSFRPQASTAARAAVASLHSTETVRQITDLDVTTCVGTRKVSCGDCSGITASQECYSSMSSGAV